MTLEQLQENADRYIGKGKVRLSAELDGNVIVGVLTPAGQYLDVSTEKRMSAFWEPEWNVYLQGVMDGALAVWRKYD